MTPLMNMMLMALQSGVPNIGSTGSTPVTQGGPGQVAMTDDQAIDAILNVRNDMRDAAAKAGIDLRDPAARRAFVLNHLANTGKGSMSLPQYAMTQLPLYIQAKTGQMPSQREFLKTIGLLPDSSMVQWEREHELRQKALEEQQKQWRDQYELERQRFELQKQLQEANLAANPRNLIANWLYRQNASPANIGVPMPQNFTLDQLPFIQAVNGNNAGALNQTPQMVSDVHNLHNLADMPPPQMPQGQPANSASFVDIMPRRIDDVRQRWEGPSTPPPPPQNQQGSDARFWYENGGPSRTFSGGTAQPMMNPAMSGDERPFAGGNTRQVQPMMNPAIPRAVQGNQVNPQVWNRLKPSEQQGYLSVVSANGQDTNDFLDDYKRSLPKGNFSGLTRWR